MIHLFHGFLGRPEDLSFFSEWGETQSYDMLSFDDETFTCKESDILVGYSMGGRVALKIAHRLNYKIKKIIILNANPNKLSEDEKAARLNFEESVKEKMLTMSVSDFLQYWNGLSIFKDDAPISEVTESELRQWAGVFAKHRLSDQADYLADLKNHPYQFSWIVGSLDKKYLDIAQKSELSFFTIPAGHRLFQHPQKIIDLIKKENIL